MIKKISISILAITFSFLSLAFADIGNKKANIKQCHNGAYLGNIKLVKSCLNHGFDINQKDKKGRTLLQMAIIGEGQSNISKKNKNLRHNIKLINFLYKQSDLSLVNNRGESIVHSIAIKVNSENKEKYRKLLTSLQPPFNLEDNYKRTPLMSAAYAGNNTAVSLLLELGVDPNHRNQLKQSVSKYIAIGNNRQALLLLIDAGLDLFSVDNSGYTLIAHVIKYGRVGLFEDLMEFNNKQIFEKNSSQYYEAAYDGTLFDIALAGSHLHIADRLLDAGYPIDYQKKFGETALMKYAMARSIEKLEYLISRKAQKSIRDSSSETALEKAIYANNKNAIKVLK